MIDCGCSEPHASKRIALTGGPGAGKTAVLELVRQSLCRHLHVLPEAAGIVFGGGFPRRAEVDARQAAQRAIYHVQCELERALPVDVAIVLCDRGTVDGSAYWPGPGTLWQAVGTTAEAELARYDVVIHLRTPTAGYDRSNPLRVESAAQAREIDDRIASAWARHPRRFEVPATADFMIKAERAVAILHGELPDCCRRHLSPASR